MCIVLSGVAAGEVDLPGDCLAVTAGVAHCVAIVAGTAGSGHRAMSWGRNQHAQLAIGDASTASVAVPTAAEPIGSGSTVREVAAGAGTAFAVTEAGSVYAWGGNQLGQLGVKPDSSQGAVSAPMYLRLAPHRTLNLL